MIRWIAFDSQTAAALTASQIVPEVRDADNALREALSSERDAVVLMPSNATGLTTVVQVRHTPFVDPTPRPVAYQAGGFLGLTDEPIFEEEPAKPKKWWQRILE